MPPLDDPCHSANEKTIPLCTEMWLSREGESWNLDLKRLYLLCELCAEFTFGDLDVVSLLKVEPKLRGIAAGQPHGGVHRDRPMAVDDIVHASGWDVEIASQLILAESQLLKELVEQNLPWMNRRESFRLAHPASLNAI